MDQGIKNLREYGFDTTRSTFVIAELGINHGGDVDVAKKLIDSAARTGVDAVKFQTYITEKRVPEGNQAMFDVLKKCELPFRAFNELKSHSSQRKLGFISTPFDEDSVEYLDSIECDVFKVASFDVANCKLLNKIAKTHKAVIMSVGMAKLEEIQEGFSILKKGTDSIALLHCISSYPTNKEDSNLASIYTLKERFDCIIGHSDHTNDIQVPLYAVAAGAQIIEKHFKTDNEMDCIDASVSITESQMKQMVEEIREIEIIFGRGEFGVRQAEIDMAVFRRFSDR